MAQAGGDTTQAWSSLQAAWDSGGVCEAAAAPLAAAGLLSISGADPQRLQWVMHKLEAQVHNDSSSSAAVASALWGLAHAVCYSHPTDHTARATALATFRAAASMRLHPGGRRSVTAAAPRVIGAALGGLALLVKSCLPLLDLSAESASAPTQATQAEPAQVVSQAVALLLSVLVTLQPQWVESTFSMAAGLPAVLQPVELIELNLSLTVPEGGDGAAVEGEGSGAATATASVLAAALHALADVAAALAAASGLPPGVVGAAAGGAAAQPLLLQLHSLVVGCVQAAVADTALSPGASTSDATGQRAATQLNQEQHQVHVHLGAAVHALPVILQAMDNLGWQPPAVTLQGSNPASGITPPPPAPSGVLGAVQQLVALAAQPQLPGGLRGAACLSMGLVAGLPSSLQLLTTTAPPEPLAQQLAQLHGGTSKTAAGSVAAAVAEVLACILAGEGGVSKGSQAAAARSGAALGLGAFLAGPSSLGSGSSPTSSSSQASFGGGSVLGGVLSMLDDVPQLGKRCVRALEGLASPGSAAPAGGGAAGVGAGAGAAAAWVLAACSAALAAQRASTQGGGGGGAGEEERGTAAGAMGAGRGVVGTGGGGVDRPLSAYPEDGALRPLINALTQLAAAPGNTATATATATPPPSVALSPLVAGGTTAVPATVSGTMDRLAAAAAVLRCLAAAPRLPANVDLGSMCRRLLVSAASGSSSSTPSNSQSPAVSHSMSLTPIVSLPAAVMEVQVAVVQLLLAHAASAPSTGLPGLLDELLGVSRFKSLPQPAQIQLLQHLPAALASLAPSRAAPIFTPLPAVAAAAGPAVAAALWDGLRGVMSAAAAAHASGRAAPHGVEGPAPEAVTSAREAVAALLPPLPPLPALLPGELAAMQEVLLGRPNPASAVLPAPSHTSHTPVSLSQQSGAPGPLTPLLKAAAAGAPTANTAARIELMHLWVAAARCLVVMRTAELPPSLSTPQPLHPQPTSNQLHNADSAAWESALAACQLRCLIVIAGVGNSTVGASRGAATHQLTGPLGAKDLVPCRALCVDAPEPIAVRCRRLVATAMCASAAHASQVQVLLETLGLVRLAPDPVGPLRMAAALMGAAAVGVCGPQAVLDDHVAATAPGMELASLPFLAPR